MSIMRWNEKTNIFVGIFFSQNQLLHQITRQGEKLKINHFGLVFDLVMFSNLFLKKMKYLMIRNPR